MDIQLITEAIGSVILMGIVPVIVLIVGIILLRKKSLHKAIPITMIVLGGAVLAWYLFNGAKILLMFNTKAAASISIIGGADGPTSIFLVGKLNTPNYGMLIVGIVLLAIGLSIIFKKKIPFLKSYGGVKDIPKYSVTMGYGVLVAAIFLLLGAIINIHVAVLTLGCIIIGLATLIIARKYM